MISVSAIVIGVAVFNQLFNERQVNCFVQPYQQMILMAVDDILVSEPTQERILKRALCFEHRS